MSETQTVSAGKVVSIHYKLTLDGGQVVDTSEGGDPLAYVHGANNIVPGLENALSGKSEGEQFAVSIDPGEGYGERNPGAIQTVPRNVFPDDARVEAGVTFQAVDENQNPLLGTIAGVEGDQVTVDFNHPLAGKTLHFEIQVADVREATDEERQHGHAHGEGDEAH